MSLARVFAEPRTKCGRFPADLAAVLMLARMVTLKHAKRSKAPPTWHSHFAAALRNISLCLKPAPICTNHRKSVSLCRKP